MHLCTCVSEEGGDGESAGSEALSLLSYTLRFVSLAGLGKSINKLIEAVYYETIKRELKIRPI